MSHSREWWSGTRGCCTLPPLPTPGSGGLTVWPSSCLLLPRRQGCSLVQVRGRGKGGADWPVRQLPCPWHAGEETPLLSTRSPCEGTQAVRGRQVRFQMSCSPSHLRPHLISCLVPAPRPGPPVTGCGVQDANIQGSHWLPAHLQASVSAKSTRGCQSSWKGASLRVIFLFVFV